LSLFVPHISLKSGTLLHVFQQITSFIRVVRTVPCDNHHATVPYAYGLGLILAAV
jgi:hypothetical protein